MVETTYPHKDLQMLGIGIMIAGIGVGVLSLSIFRNKQKWVFHPTYKAECGQNVVFFGHPPNTNSYRNMYILGILYSLLRIRRDNQGGNRDTIISQINQNLILVLNLCIRVDTM